MDQLPFHILFLGICICVGVYINRNRFGGLQHTVMGVPLPMTVISAALSVFIGLMLWITIEVVLLQFHF